MDSYPSTSGYFGRLMGHRKSIPFISTPDSSSSGCLNGLSSPNKYDVPPSLFSNNRKRVVDILRQENPHTLIVLKGGKERYVRNTYRTELFRQVPNFRWLFGVNEPGYWAAINVASGLAYLFHPLPNDACSGCSALLDEETLLDKYGVDVVRSLLDMESTLAAFGVESMLVLEKDPGYISERPDFPTMKCYNVDESTLWPVLLKLRMVKTSDEVELIQFLTTIVCEGIRCVMKSIKPDVEGYWAESIFRFYLQYIGNCKDVSKIPLCTTVNEFIYNKRCSASLPNSATIKNGDMCYFDMGASYCGYNLDSVITFPINSRFTEAQKVVHEIALGVRERLLSLLKPGLLVQHFLESANGALVHELMKAELLRGGEASFDSQRVSNLLTLLPLFDIVDVEKIPPDFLTNGSFELGMILKITSQCFFPSYRISTEDGENYFGTSISKYVDCGSVIQDILLLTDGGNRLLSKNPVTISEIEGLKDEPYFLQRVGKNVALFNASRLFPDADELISNVMKEVRKKSGA